MSPNLIAVHALAVALAFSSHPAPPVAPTGPHVPILMYHYVEGHDDKRYPKGKGLFMPPAEFDEQMQWLEDHHVRTIDMDELAASLETSAPTPEKTVVLTFDDGYEDAYTDVFPVLRAHHLKAVFYIVSGFIGKKGYMNAKQIAELDAAGMMIAAHSVNHLDLSKLKPADRDFQLRQSKLVLEKLIGHPIVHFAYPSGKYNKEVIEEAKKLGYVTAVTTHAGYATQQSPLLTLPRVRMMKGVKIEDIAF